MVNHIKAQRLSWFGHVQRMPDTRRVKKIFKWSPLTKRSQGRPKYRWEDKVKQDICQMKVKNWITCVQDRGKWKDSWVKRDQHDATCFIITLFGAQHVSDVNTSILRSLRLIRWVTSWVVSGSMCVGVTLWYGCGGVVSVCRLQPAYGYHTTTATLQRNTNTHRTRAIQPMK